MQTKEYQNGSHFGITFIGKTEVYTIDALIVSMVTWPLVNQTFFFLRVLSA